MRPLDSGHDWVVSPVHLSDLPNFAVGNHASVHRQIGGEDVLDDALDVFAAEHLGGPKVARALPLRSVRVYQVAERIGIGLGQHEVSTSGKHDFSAQDLWEGIMDSPFTPLLNTNYAPSKREIYQINELVEVQKASLEETKRKVQALNQQQKAQEQFIAEHPALTTPARRIDTDILSVAFFTYLEDHKWRSSYRGNRHPIVLLTHLALGLPSLWNTIRVETPYYNSPTPATQRFLDGNNFFDRAMECRNIWAKHKSDWQDRLAIAIDQAVVCLNRSAGCSLSLTFNCFDNPGADFQEGVSRRLTPLARVHVSLDFSNKSEPAQSELAWKRATILATSSIRTLKLARTCLNLAHKPITWAILTLIYIGSTWIDPYHQPNSHGLSTSDAFEVLRRCPNLTRCFLVFLPDGAPTPGNTPPTLVPDEKVSLPRLEFLGVHATILPNGFASSLSLPRLRTLSAFSTTGERQDRDANGLVEWITRFGEQLTDVTFNYSSVDHSTLLYCLYHLPNMRSLRLADIYGTYDPADRNAPPRDLPKAFDTTTLARLTPEFDSEAREVAVKLRCRLGFFEGMEKALMDLVAARRPDNELAISRLQEVEVKYDGSRTMNHLKVLDGRGVDVSGLRLKLRASGQGMTPFLRLTSAGGYIPYDEEYVDVFRHE
ncbi:hypothetical protein DFP72DRAFT_852737 [Ephemerocybe angulata]|uniref:Uncharacterized protein n=1 Tax=Ephemerocybe angulata TaxID=980116 RepID=A0A8H6HLN9_9AGAR|nr:hypothetical protein DFP72DRAFT_852737 [Tulosesus angulatus]